MTIKARIWNPHGKNMIHDVENVFECLMQQLVHDKAQPSRGFKLPYNHRAEGMEWMLSTGEQDINEKEIFAADIIKCPKGRNDVVIFKRGAFWLRYRDIALYRFLYELKAEVEIIGNTFENPELAEV